jgi:hypothetical protein
MTDSSEQTTNLSDSMTWLEHETKINEALRIALEAKATNNVLSIAISSISELSSTIKELKNIVGTLQTELAISRAETATLRMEMHGMTPEEKERMKTEITEILKRELHLMLNRTDLLTNTCVFEKDWERLSWCIENIIVPLSKSYEQGIRVANKLVTDMNCGYYFGTSCMHGNPFMSFSGENYIISRDNIIVYYVNEAMSKKEANGEWIPLSNDRFII